MSTNDPQDPDPPEDQALQDALAAFLAAAKRKLDWHKAKTGVVAARDRTLGMLVVDLGYSAAQAANLAREHLRAAGLSEQQIREVGVSPETATNAARALRMSRHQEE
jgi:hypothetical protein